MIVVPDYREHRIEIAAAPANGGRFNAVVHIRRILSDARPLAGLLGERDVNLEARHRFDERWAKRWIDVHRGDR